MLALLFLVLISGVSQVEPFGIPSFSDIKALFEFAYDMYSKLNDAHDTYNKFQTTASLEDIMSTVSDISRDVNAIGTKIEKKLDVIVQTLLNRLPLVAKINDDLGDLHDRIIRIDGLYRDFETYVKDRDEFNNATLKEFAQTITSHRAQDVNDNLIKMHGIVFPGRTSVLKESLVLLLSQQTQMNRLDLCDTGTPPQQRLFEIYEVIVLTEIRAYLMAGFAYTLRSTFEEGNFMREVLHWEQQLERRVGQYLRVFKMAMSWAPRTLRRCDPPSGPKRDRTFLEFERFIGTYIAQEDALTSDHNCFATCDSLPNPTYRYFDCDGYQCDGEGTQGCDGTITGCSSGENTMQLCAAERIPPAWFNPRRYYWFRNGKGNLFGNNAGGCRGTLKNPVWFWKHSVYSCDVCVCTCIEDSPKSEAYHFVSLREVVSDIDNNMIVTGLKFIRHEWVVQLKIQQGKLAGNGTIEANTVSWKAHEDFAFEPPWAKALRAFYFRIQTEGSGYPRLWPDKDVAVFDFQRRAINLDELRAPKEHVITGVRFARVSGKSPNDSPIQLEIRATPFDYVKGTLSDIDSSVWITPYDMRKVMDVYKRERERIPQSWNAKNPLDMLITVPDFTPNKYIRIERTGVNEDAGQTVVPLLDALEVAANPAMPIVGINFFHKQADGYGGFLSLQIETVDRTAYIQIPELNGTDDWE